MPKPSQKSMDDVMQMTGGFGLYQTQLLLITQLSYAFTAINYWVPNVLTMTQPGFCIFEGPGWTQVSANVSGDLCNCTSVEYDGEQIEFYSLFMHLGVTCRTENHELALKTVLMVGGVLGAAVFGWFADYFGRRLMCVVTLAMLVVSDFVLVGATSLAYAIPVIAVIGMAGGGMMTMNVAFLIECVGPDHRLLCVVLNGWPLGMMVAALTGYLTAHWRWHVLATACLGVPLPFLFWHIFESPRWLVQHGRLDDAAVVLAGITARNRRPEIDNLKQVLTDVGAPVEKVRSYTYMDLARDRHIRKNLAAVFYSFFAPSVISYGIYYIIGDLTGNTFFNMFLMGLVKGTCGFIPYIAGCRLFNVGRKPIMTVFVYITCTIIWICVTAFYAIGEYAIKSSVIIGLIMVGSAAIDPIWKINHLYSIELFPTIVRGLACGVCHVGARIGTITSPAMQFLSKITPVAPYWIYGFVAIGHVIVASVSLVETQGEALPEKWGDGEREVEKDTDSLHSIDG